MPLQPWPSEAVIIVAPPPDEALIDPDEMTIGALCRRCLAAVLVRASTIDRARGADYLHGRPIEFFCIACAVQHDRRSIDVLEDLR